MPARSAQTQRPAKEWAGRLFLAVALAAVGYVGVTRTVAIAMAPVDVEEAHVLAPGNGRISGLLAQDMAGADATAADRARADRLARRALRQDPTAVAAVSTLGIDAQLRGDTRAARRLFAYAEKLTRRDLQTELWAIEDAVGRGDVAGAVKHYDVALRTSSKAPDLLFPILSTAIAAEPVRSALIQALIARPEWGSHFIGYAAGQGADPRATAVLFAGLGRAGLPPRADAQAALVDRLIGMVSSEDAWAYYASIHPRVTRFTSRDPNFTARATPSSFDWTPIGDTSVSTSLQAGPHGGLVDFSAPAGVGGTVVRQSQMLLTGSYRIEGHSIGVDQAAAASPYWVLTCQDGRELGRVMVSNSDQRKGLFAGRFDVPNGCPAQTLSLVIRASDAVAGISGQIDRVFLHPASPAARSSISS